MRSIIVVCSLLAVACNGLNVTRTRFRPLPVSSSRIINGVTGEQGEFPSQLSLQLLRQHICGASILNRRWALTAAHCVLDHKASQLFLLSGTNDLEADGTIHPVSVIVVHNYYVTIQGIHDIAVLKVTLPFFLDGLTRTAVTLPQMDQSTVAEEVATVIGWGRVSNNVCEPLPTLLQKVDLQIMDQEQCAAAEFLDFLNPYQICAYSEEPKNGCVGDSGGPLFVDDVIVGIVSRGVNEMCGQPNVPGIFTRVAPYVGWIAEITGCMD